MKFLTTTLFLLTSINAYSAERIETVVSDIDFKASILVRTIQCRQGIPNESFPVPTVVTIPSKRLTTNFKVDRLLLQNADELHLSLPPETDCVKLLSSIENEERIQVNGNKKVTFLSSIRNDRGLENECQVTSHEELSIEIFGHKARGLANMIILPADPKFCE